MSPELWFVSQGADGLWWGEFLVVEGVGFGAVTLPCLQQDEFIVSLKEQDPQIKIPDSGRQHQSTTKFLVDNHKTGKNTAGSTWYKFLFSLQLDVGRQQSDSEGAELPAPPEQLQAAPGWSPPGRAGAQQVGKALGFGVSRDGRSGINLGGVVSLGLHFSPRSEIHDFLSLPAPDLLKLSIPVKNTFTLRYIPVKTQRSSPIDKTTGQARAFLLFISDLPCKFAFSSPFAANSATLTCCSWCLFVCPVTWRKLVWSMKGFTLALSTASSMKG